MSAAPIDDRLWARECERCRFRWDGLVDAPCPDCGAIRASNAASNGQVGYDEALAIFEAARDGDVPAAVDLKRVDLLPAWRGERRRPEAMVLERSDGARIFPAGINYIFGDSGDGKSWVTLVAALQLMRSGTAVVLVTYEDPNEIDIVERLQFLGCTETELAFLHLLIPHDPFTEIVDAVAHYCRREQVALVVLDSVGDALAVDGVNEDSDAEFGPWARRCFRHLLDVVVDELLEVDTAPCPGLAIVPIDHATKSKSSPHFPSGTKRKRAIVTGLMVSVDVRMPFGRGVVGRINLVCSKDRSGRFRRGEIVAEFMLDATEDVYRFTIDAPPADRAMTSATKRRVEDRVLAVIGDTDVDLSAAEIERIANGPEHTLAGEGSLSLGAVRNALTKLSKRPNVTRKVVHGTDGKGVRHVYHVEEAENVPD